LASSVDLSKPDDVKAFIANKQVSNGFRGNLVKAYNYYCSINGIAWDRPHYNWEQNKPKIPTQETLNKIIASCGYKYIVIFTLLEETGAMPVELSRTTLRDIDFERNTLAIRGSKGHASRIHKLRSEVIAMLKTYLAIIGMKEYPFPSPKQMTKAWIKYKKRLSQRLCDSMLLQIRLYDLRHFYATMTYHKTKDILYTKQQMGHKKIETTLLYTQLVNFENDEFTSAVAKTIEEARNLIESGFEYVTELDGVKLFRKRK
jgi:integrase